MVAAGLVGWASPAGRMWLVAAALGASLPGSETRAGRLDGRSHRLGPDQRWTG